MIFDEIRIINVLLFSTLILSCDGEKEIKKIPEDFIHNVVLNESYDLDGIHEYVNISKDSVLDKSHSFYLIEMHLEFLRERLKKSEPFNILNSKEFRLVAFSKNYKVNYEDKNQIYYLIRNEKLICCIIINNKKSFLFLAM